jgi:hypothetical protein
MRKWFKRLTLFLVGLFFVVAITMAFMYRRAPEWLRRPISAAEQAAAASRIEEKLRDAMSVVGEMSHYDASSQPAPSTQTDLRPIASQPPRPLKIEVSEDELNALFAKWDKLYGWTERFKEHIRDPSLVLYDGRMILAGQSPDMGTVVSIHFEPKLDTKGQLQLRLTSVLAGRLPLPQAFQEKYRTSARNKLNAVLPNLQRKANIDSSGVANGEAVSAAMAKLFLHVLADEPGDAVLFVPLVKKGSVPVRLTDVKIDEKNLTLTVKPMDVSERESLLTRIREKDNTQTVMNDQPRS